MEMNDLTILIYGMILILIIAALLLPMCAFILSGRLSDVENGLTRVGSKETDYVDKPKTQDSQRASNKFRYTFPMP